MNIDYALRFSSTDNKRIRPCLLKQPFEVILPVKKERKYWGKKHKITVLADKAYWIRLKLLSSDVKLNCFENSASRTTEAVPGNIHASSGYIFYLLTRSWQDAYRWSSWLSFVSICSYDHGLEIWVFIVFILFIFLLFNFIIKFRSGFTLLSGRRS